MACLSASQILTDCRTRNGQELRNVRAAFRVNSQRQLARAAKHAQPSRFLRQGPLCVAEEGVDVRTKAAAPAASSSGNFVPAIAPEDLPKGVRKEVKVNGVSVLLFWYRNEICAIEARSPAEGAYSEGFISAKFTQDYGIECPATKSVFSLKTGEILEWYPSNPVLRALTPASTCRKMEIYPVQLAQDAIMVDVTAADASRATASMRGGADSSIERNNVYGLEPKMYVDGDDPTDLGSLSNPSKSTTANAATLITSTIAVAAVAVAGTATAIYYENFIALGIFWLILFGVVASFVFQYVSGEEQ